MVVVVITVAVITSFFLFSVLQTESFDSAHSRASTGHPSFNTFRPMQRSLESLQAISLAQRHLATTAGSAPHTSHLSDTLPHRSLRLPQDIVHLQQSHQSIHGLANNNNCTSITPGNKNSNGMISYGNGPIANHLGSSPRLASSSSPSSSSHQDALEDRDQNRERDRNRDRALDHEHDQGMEAERERERKLSACDRGDEDRMDDSEVAPRRTPLEEKFKTRERHNSMEYIRADPSHNERASSADYHYDYHHHQHQNNSHHLLNHIATSRSNSASEDGGNHHHQHHSVDSMSSELNILPSAQSTLPPHTSSAIESSDARLPQQHHQHQHQAYASGIHHHHHHHSDHNSGNNGGSSSGYPCDSVMDLSINKSAVTPPSRTSSNTSSSADHKEITAISMPPPKTPTSVGGGESESESGKRDVTTTSATPIADSGGGIHHCHHCNIFFYDYTMFHLHESLHLPYEDDPFRCPSCGTHCQDKIEFMFHTVWHVKYPHTIPNYTPFREGIMSSP